MKKLIFFASLFVFILISCKQSQEFDDIIEFSSNPLTLEGILFGEEIYVKTEPLFIDDILLVTTFSAPFFNVFSNDSLILKFGAEGRGPGEYTSPPSLTNFIGEEDSASTLFFNPIKSQADFINFTRSISESKLYVYETLRIPDELNHGFVYYFLYNENILVGQYEDRMAKKVDEKAGIFLYDRNAEMLEFGELFNYYTKPFHLVTELNVNNRFTTVSQTNQKIAVATLYYPSIEIVDLNDLSSRKRYLLEAPPPLDGFNQEAYEMEELNQYVLDITSTDNALYLLYVDNNSKAEEKQRMIKVIDWDGNPIDQYRISKGQPIDQITVHSSGKTLVGVSWEQDALYRYDL